MDAVAELPPHVDPTPARWLPGRPLRRAADVSEARAGSCGEAELIGGEGAAGRVGHLKIYNGRVRFIVQGAPRRATRAVGYRSMAAT